MLHDEKEKVYILHYKTTLLLTSRLKLVIAHNTNTEQTKDKRQGTTGDLIARYQYLPENLRMTW